MRKKIFYGWYIVVAGILIAAAGIGFHNTASIFIRPVTEDLGLSRGEFTLFRTIMVIIGAALLPFYGRLAKRYSIKKIMLVGTTVNGLSLISYALCTYLWQFYLVAVVNGIFMNAAHFMLIGILIGRWFKDKQGLALGIAFAGSGLGAAIMVPLASWVIESAGWRWGFVFSGTASIAVLIPTLVLLLKDRPEDMGLTPYETGKGMVIESDEATMKGDGAPIVNRQPKGLHLSQARKTPAFWLLTIALLCISIGVAAPNAHTAPYLGDLGYPVHVISAVVSLTMVMLMLGKIIMGHVFDRFGTMVGGIMLGVFCILAPVFALLSAHPVAPWFHAIFLGLASTGFSIPVNIFAMKYFGEKDFPAILSVLSMIIAFGAAFSPPVMGFAYDFFRDYVYAWQVLVALGAIATLGLIGVNLTGAKLVQAAAANSGDL